jgi:hypothetical protein
VGMVFYLCFTACSCGCSVWRSVVYRVPGLSQKDHAQHGLVVVVVAACREGSGPRV